MRENSVSLSNPSYPSLQLWTHPDHCQRSAPRLRSKEKIKKTAFFIHKANNTVTPGSSPKSTQLNTWERKEREGTSERATTFHQNALEFSLKSISLLTMEELLFLPVALLKFVKTMHLRK